MKWDEPCIFPGMGLQTQLSYLGEGWWWHLQSKGAVWCSATEFQHRVRSLLLSCWPLPRNLSAHAQIHHFSRECGCSSQFLGEMTSHYCCLSWMWLGFRWEQYRQLRGILHATRFYCMSNKAALRCCFWYCKSQLVGVSLYIALYTSGMRVLQKLRLTEY